MCSETVPLSPFYVFTNCAPFKICHTYGVFCLGFIGFDLSLYGPQGQPDHRGPKCRNRHTVLKTPHSKPNANRLGYGTALVMLGLVHVTST